MHGERDYFPENVRGKFLAVEYEQCHDFHAPIEQQGDKQFSDLRQDILHVNGALTFVKSQEHAVTGQKEEY